MKQFFYVYILQSKLDSQRFYIGLTNDLQGRLRNHNSGRIVHTSKWKPWQVKTTSHFAIAIDRLGLSDI